MENQLDIQALEDAHYLPQLLSSADARRVVADACERYARDTLGRDRAIADQLANYFKVAA